MSGMPPKVEKNVMAMCPFPFWKRHWSAHLQVCTLIVVMHVRLPSTWLFVMKCCRKILTVVLDNFAVCLFTLLIQIMFTAPHSNLSHYIITMMSCSRWRKACKRSRIACWCCLQKVKTKIVTKIAIVKKTTIVMMIITIRQITWLTIINQAMMMMKKSGTCKMRHGRVHLSISPSLFEILITSGTVHWHSRHIWCSWPLLCHRTQSPTHTYKIKWCKQRLGNLMDLIVHTCMASSPLYPLCSVIALRHHCNYPNTDNSLTPVVLRLRCTQ